MCTAKTPEYTPPPSYAKEKAPDDAALYASAQARASQRAGGAKRSTVLSGLQGVTGPASTAARTNQRTTTALG